MQRSLDELSAFLESNSLDGYLIDAPGTDADQRYLTGFGAVDPFTSLYQDGAIHLLVRDLDRGLARDESRADTVAGPSEYDRREKVERYGQAEADHRVVEAFLSDHGADRVGVPARFPVARADTLRSLGVDVVPTDRDVVALDRAVKTPDEIEHVRSAQRATEAAMARTEELLRTAISRDGELRLDGETLTSERVKQEIEVTLVRNGCALEETIVACGAAAADPHERGSGPLAPDEPIVIDIFPRDGETKYHADMTRTFCVGEPSETAAAWHDLTEEAQAAAFDALGPGVTGATVHDAVCEVYEDAGLPTTRSDEGAETGFIHGTGHGIGLEVHEYPRLNPDGAELEPGHVVTVEPGLYDPAVGGIRIEDLVVITDDGFENLTDYHKDFVVS